ncbi:MAG: C4-dicarboxylate TRAP transporter substrate-binding protein [Rhizobiaceae bacterium]|nr:C4-dicarboxylate TRAP transporter substrate-binding protein [Rhizobiaceae bacterium]
MARFGKLASALLMAAACVAAPSVAGATDYTFSTELEPNHLLTKNAHEPWVEAIRNRTNGEVNLKVYSAGALLPPKGTLQGISDGVVQGAFVSAGYLPSEMPLWNVIGDMGFVHPNDWVLAMAATEFGLMDPDGSDDWKRNNVVYLGTTSTPIYHFLCGSELKSLSDFAGKRVRAPGGAWSRFVESIGAVPVNIGSTEMYTAFERGAIDCSTSDVTHITGGATLKDVIRSINMLDIGPFFSQGTWVLNKEFWAGLTPDERAIIIDETARGIVRVQMAAKAAVDFNLQAAKDTGRTTIVDPSEDLQAAYKKFVDGGLGGLSEIAAKNNVPNHERALKSLGALMDKWEGLLANVDKNDEEALVKLVKSEIFDKLDVNSYGIN